MTGHPVFRPLARAALLLGGLALAAGAPAGTARAQTSTASLRGYVRNAAGAPVSDVQVELQNPASGTRRAGVTNASGFYNLSALPPAQYSLRARRIGFQPVERSIVLRIGETQSLDIEMTEAATQLSSVIITATVAPSDIRTPEVGTNVSTQQIENLPVGDRNFLTLATLAPGVQQRNGGISAGGTSVSNSNLFIDGASFKSDVLPGGVAGQDPSIGRNIRGVGQVQGNPFPQGAVQEFRVITQNYKAEYQKATGAIITASTKSGTNQLHGDMFYYGQNQHSIARSYWEIKDKFQKPKYHRNQFGGSIGGPIIKDRTHFFASYEGNQQYLESRVNFTIRPGLAAPPDSLLAGQGLFGAPLRSNLFFGKIDHQVNDKQALMFTANVRHDYDTRDFGGGSIRSTGNDVKNDVNTFVGRHTWSSQPYTNEAQISFQRFQWQQLPNVDAPRLEFQEYGITRGGGRTTQDFVQDRLSLRNDLSWTAAQHVVKGGANVDLLRYDIMKLLDQNPVFRFSPNRPGGISTPFEASLQIGDPNLKTNNQQLGAYIQDDWAVNQRLTLNLGLRWDFESDWLNNNYVTPRNERDSVLKFLADHPGAFNPTDYFTDGPSDRKRFYGAFQPRLGFSYDATSSGRTVIFGGGGLFYDRTVYNTLLDEKYKGQRRSYTIQFSPTGDPASGVVRFDPKYYNRDELVKLIQSGAVGNEVFLVNNKTRPPKSVQATLGVRQAIGRQLQFSASGVMNNSYNNFKWVWGHRDPVTGDLFFGQHGIGAILRSTDEGRGWYKAALFSLSRPMTMSSRWGGDINYTLSKTETNTYGDVEEQFAGLDYIPNLDSIRIFLNGTPTRIANPLRFKRIPSRFDERHRVVANFVVRAPFGIRASTITTLGSGLPYTLSTGCTNPNDIRTEAFCANQPVPPAPVPGFLANPAGFGNPRTERPEGKWFGPFGKWAYRNVDFRLQTDLSVAGQKLGVFADLYNAFNFVNFNYDNFEYNLRWDTNQGAGPIRQRIPFGTYDPRRFQLGARYQF